MRLIDADALIAWIDVGHLRHPSELCFSEIDVVNMVNHAPTIEPERKKGRWEMLQIPINPPIYKCSECGSHALQIQTGRMTKHYEVNLTNYCPNCGARMQDGQ